MSLTPNRQRRREPSGRPGGNARPPVRWSVWELVLLTMSVFMIASPLLAAGYALLVPTAAPAKQAVQTVAQQRVTSTPCGPICPTETPVVPPTAIPTPGEPFPTDDPSPRTPEPTNDPYPGPTDEPPTCGVVGYPAPCTPTPTEEIPATAEPTATTEPTVAATAEPTTTSAPVSGFRVTKEALGLNGQSIVQVSQGSEYLYSIRVDNPVNPAQVVELVDVFDDNLQPISILGVDNGSCELLANTLVCSLVPSVGNIATVVVRVKVIGAAGANIPNTVTATIPSTGQSTSASSGDVTVDPLAPTPLPATAGPPPPTVTQGPPPPTVTQGPPPPSVTAGPPPPTVTQGPPPPTVTQGPAATARPQQPGRPRDPEPEPATATPLPTIAVLPTLPPGATAAPATAVPPTAAPPAPGATAKPPTKATARPTAKPNVVQPSAAPAVRQPQTQPTATIQVVPSTPTAPAPTPGPTLPPVTTPEPGEPSVRFNLASNWGQVFVGDTMEYEIALQNAGIDAGGSSPLMGTPRRVKQEALESVPVLKDVVIVDELDPAFEIIEATSAGMAVTTDGQKVEATRPTLAGGELVTVRIKVRARSVAVSGVVLNQATLRHADTADAIFSNVVAVTIVLKDAPTATPAPTEPPTATPAPSVMISGGTPAATPEELSNADLPHTSGGIPLSGFVLLGLTMLLHSVRAHRARSRI